MVMCKLYVGADAHEKSREFTRAVAQSAQRIFPAGEKATSRTSKKQDLAEIAGNHDDVVISLHIADARSMPFAFILEITYVCVELPG
jgi:hypothetical protein